MANSELQIGEAPKVYERAHRRLLVWKEAISLARLTYELTEGFPAGERFGIAQQMRRAAVSVASNIAEGAGRRTSPEKIRFFVMAQGSLSELDTQLEIVRGLGCGFGPVREDFQNQIDTVGRLLSGLLRSRESHE